MRQAISLSKSVILQQTIELYKQVNILSASFVLKAGLCFEAAQQKKVTTSIQKQGDNRKPNDKLMIKTRLVYVFCEKPLNYALYYSFDSLPIIEAQSM